MKHNNCIDCGAVILAKATRCRPCNFTHRKKQNKGEITFKCPMCKNPFLIIDKGNIKNMKRVYCSDNCREASYSACKSLNKVTRKQNSLARHRARAYMFKFGLTSSECPEIFEVLIKKYLLTNLLKEK